VEGRLVRGFAHRLEAAGGGEVARHGEVTALTPLEVVWSAGGHARRHDPRAGTARRRHQPSAERAAGSRVGDPAQGSLQVDQERLAHGLHPELVAHLVADNP
jgi:hypothetical protein